MKKKQITALALVAMLAIGSLAGCGSKEAASDGGSTTTASSDSSASTESSDASSDDGAAAAATGDIVLPAAEKLPASHDEMLTIEFYDKAANYQGIQSGWYGKVLKDALNVEVNIISPQVSGDGAALYQTRCAAGALGDLIIIDNSEATECVEAGLIADLTPYLSAYPNLMRYEEQIIAFNKMIGNGDKVYAIPLEMNTYGPTAFKDPHVSVYPRVGWDMYTEQGRPELKNMDDLLDLLEAIQTAHPTNDNGDPAYAISMWADWDGTSIENVNQVAKWYGQQVNGSVLLGTDNSIAPLTDKNGAYYKMLNFFYKANQRGLIDPDSVTQDWNNVVSKMQDKRIYLYWYSWQYGFWNTPERGEQGVNMMEIPVADTNLFQEGNFYYGDGRVVCVGSQVPEENLGRMLEFLDWYASPEGAQIQHAGTEGIVYTVNDDGTLTLTEDGLNRFSAEIMIPEDQGGGTWNDGNNAINQWIAQSVDLNPNTGEPYGTDLWSSYIEMNQTKCTKEWSEQFGAADDVAYLADHGLMTVLPSINMALAVDTTDISLIRNQCGDLICDTSWRMVFASSDEEFEQMWDDMTTQLQGFGWDELVEFDTAKYQPVIEARIAAMQ